MALFHVPTGPCAGTFDGVYISTDLEPDDALCLLALARKLRGVPLLVIVGEGPVDKRQMVATLRAALKLGRDELAEDREVINARKPNGCTALYLAAETGCAEAVEMLLQHGAQAAIPSNNGETPLFVAAFGDPPVVTIREIRKQSWASVSQSGASPGAVDQSERRQPGEIKKLPGNLFQFLYSRQQFRHVFALREQCQSPHYQMILSVTCVLLCW